jgi:hypothetical protein
MGERHRHDDNVGGFGGGVGHAAHVLGADRIAEGFGRCRGALLLAGPDNQAIAGLRPAPGQTGTEGSGAAQYRNGRSIVTHFSA